MREPSVAGSALANLLIYGLLMPELCVAAQAWPNVTKSQRIGQAFIFLSAFVLGVLILGRVRFGRLRAFLYSLAINFLALSLMALLVVPGNEQMQEELLCSGFSYVCLPYKSVQGKGAFGELELLRVTLAVHSVLALVLSVLELGALQLWYLVRGLWSAARRKSFGEC